jgi:hypothetical protein
MIAMKSIILYDFEVQNLLKNGKGQIRRVFKVQPPGDHYKLGRETSGKYEDKMFWYDDYFCCSEHFKCPFGAVGEEIWCKETWCEKWEDPGGWTGEYYYRSDGTKVSHVDSVFKSPWKSPVTMPREASRLTIVPDKIWRERVQDITHEDACAEGFDKRHCQKGYVWGTWGRLGFSQEWDSHAKPGYKFADNPMVFAAEVKVK